MSDYLLKKIDQLPAAGAVTATDQIPISQNGVTKKAAASNFLTAVVDNLTTSSATSAASASTVKELKRLHDFSQNANRLIFKFSDTWTITNDSTTCDITIPSGFARRIDAAAPVATSEATGSVVDNGGVVLTYTPLTNSFAYTFVSDLTAIPEGNDENVFIIAKNVGGVMLTSNASVAKYLYDTAINPYPYAAKGDPTGFFEPENISVEYSSSTRTIILAGTLQGYYQGVLVSELIDGWVSPVHDDVTATYYLSYDGSSIAWRTTPWTFDHLQIAIVQYNATTKLGICVRECHGLMDWQCHQEFHKTIGTYVDSGGDVSSYALSSTTAANRRPDISELLVYDEDLLTTIPALTSKTYTQRYLTGTGQKAYTLDQADIIALSGNQPYYNQWNGSAWVQTLFTANHYGAIFLVGIPVTTDTNSQKYRFLWVQPQQTSATLSVIQALTSNNLTHGESASLLAEFVFFAKIIIQYTASNWVLTSVERITGTKINQSTQSGNFLTTVTVDGTTITGNGTPGSPLVAWKPVELAIAVSDEGTDLTTGTAKVTFRMPYAMTLQSVRANVNTAPTGATIIVDINEGGTSVLSTKLSIDASEKTSTTAATPAVISDTALADDAEITIDIDQVGSTIPGKGLKVLLKGIRA